MRILLSAIAFLAAALPTAARATCYYDADGDGYAADGATTAAENGNGSCPSRYVRRQGDCLPDAAASHPRTREVYGDGKDNNCDGSVDEPQFVYSLVRPADYSPVVIHKMSVKVNDLTSAFWLTYSL